MSATVGGAWEGSLSQSLPFDRRGRPPIRPITGKNRPTPRVPVVRFDWAGGNSMRSVSFPQRFLAVAIFVLVTASTALSQSDRGTIAGTVLDSSGAAVGNAAISVTSAETGANYGAITGSTGGFRIPDVRVGTYDVSATAPGFKIEKKTGVVVQVNSTASLEFSLQPCDVKETLTVLADAPAIQSHTSQVCTELR